MSKERLTETIGRYNQCNDKDCQLSYCDRECSHYKSMIDKLVEYEKLEEQGLLFQIPCCCKDCKHVDYAGCSGTTCYCTKNGAFMQEDDFCSHAEKDGSEAEEKLRELEEK